MSRALWDGLTLCLPSPLESLDDDLLREKDVHVWLKRDDLIHAEIAGNKWRKLRFNLVQAAENGQRTLLTFGGAYSNHIRATAAAGYYCGFKTIGIIRGEGHLPLNPSLAYSVGRGMRLSYMDRITYRQKYDPEVLAALRKHFGDFYLLPEGGTNELAVRGCMEIPAEINPDFDVICCPCGTGGTLAGIAAGLKSGQRAIGFSSLKGGDFLANDVTDLQQRTFGSHSGNWRIETSFHLGGFARKTAELELFITEFRRRNGLLLEWVYVAKMMYGLYKLISEGAFDRGSRVIAIITGSPGPE